MKKLNWYKYFGYNILWFTLILTGVPCHIKSSGVVGMKEPPYLFYQFMVLALGKHDFWMTLNIIMLLFLPRLSGPGSGWVLITWRIWNTTGNSGRQKGWNPYCVVAIEILFSFAWKWNVGTLMYILRSTVIKIILLAMFHFFIVFLFSCIEKAFYLCY